MFNTVSAQDKIIIEPYIKTMAVKLQEKIDYSIVLKHNGIQVNMFELAKEANPNFDSNKLKSQFSTKEVHSQILQMCMASLLVESLPKGVLQNKRVKFITAFSQEPSLRIWF